MGREVVCDSDTWREILFQKQITEEGGVPNIGQVVRPATAGQLLVRLLGEKWIVKLTSMELGLRGPNSTAMSF